MAEPKSDNKVSDTKSKMSGVKTEDSKREGQIETEVNREGANRDLQDRRMNTFGDNTSSTGGANNPGQHGRDGGTINDQTNNPAPTEDVISGERADDTNKAGSELQHPVEEAAASEDKEEIKKL